MFVSVDDLTAALERLGAGLDALDKVSKAKASELVRGRELPQAVEEDLVEQAAELPVEEVARAVERARLAHGAPAPSVAPQLLITRRAGHAEVSAKLDLVDAEALDVALSVAVEAAGLPKDLPYPQRRAHALGVLARFYLEHQDSVSGRAGRPHVMVLVDLEVLEARTGGSAMLGSGAVISGETARRLAEDANITRIITKGRSEVLDVGRATRTVSTGLAKAVIAPGPALPLRGLPRPTGHVRGPPSTNMGPRRPHRALESRALLVPPPLRARTRRRPPQRT